MSTHWGLTAVGSEWIHSLTAVVYLFAAERATTQHEASTLHQQRHHRDTVPRKSQGKSFIFSHWWIPRHGALPLSCRGAENMSAYAYVLFVQHSLKFSLALTLHIVLDIGDFLGVAVGVFLSRLLDNFNSCGWPRLNDRLAVIIQPLITALLLPCYIVIAQMDCDGSVATAAAATCTSSSAFLMYLSIITY